MDCAVLVLSSAAAVPLNYCPPSGPSRGSAGPTRLSERTSFPGLDQRRAGAWRRAGRGCDPGWTPEPEGPMFLATIGRVAGGGFRRVVHGGIGGGCDGQCSQCGVAQADLPTDTRSSPPNGGFHACLVCVQGEQRHDGRDQECARPLGFGQDRPREHERAGGRGQGIGRGAAAFGADRDALVRGGG